MFWFDLSEDRERLPGMLNERDAAALRGVTIIDSEVRRFANSEGLRLTLADGSVLLVSTEGDGMTVADGAAIP